MYGELIISIQVGAYLTQFGEAMETYLRRLKSTVLILFGSVYRIQSSLCIDYADQAWCT